MVDDTEAALHKYVQELLTEHRYGFSIMMLDLWELENINPNEIKNLMVVLGIDNIDDLTHITAVIYRAYIKLYFNDPFTYTNVVSNDHNNQYHDVLEYISNDLISSCIYPVLQDIPMAKQAVIDLAVSISIRLTGKLNGLITPTYVNLHSILCDDIEDALYRYHWSKLYVLEDIFIDSKNDTLSTKLVFFLYELKHVADSH